MKRVELLFYGYTWEEYAFQISSLQGIFIIYRGKIDSEGFVVIEEVLYVGYHHGIIELYEQGIIESLKDYIASTERIFMSYAEVKLESVGLDVASVIRNEVRPKYKSEETKKVSDYHLICKGNCELIPQEIVC